METNQKKKETKTLKPENTEKFYRRKPKEVEKTCIKEDEPLFFVKENPTIQPKKEQKTHKSTKVIFFILAPIVFAILISFFYSCTLSVTTVHTLGKADDLIDQQQSASPTIDTDITVPFKAI